MPRTKAADVVLTDEQRESLISAVEASPDVKNTPLGGLFAKIKAAILGDSIRGYVQKSMKNTVTKPDGEVTLTRENVPHLLANTAEGIKLLSALSDMREIFNKGYREIWREHVQSNLEQESKTFVEVAKELQEMFVELGYTKRQIENGILSSPAYHAAVRREEVATEAKLENDKLSTAQKGKLEKHLSGLLAIKQSFIVEDETDETSMDEFMSKFTLG